MWALEPRAEGERLAAMVAVLAAVAASVRLEELGDRLRREEHRAWWASNGRDVINAAALLVIAAALVLLGFPGPAALVMGGLLTMALTGVTVLEAKLPERLHPRLFALALGLALAVPLLAWPEAMALGLGRLAEALFGGG